MSTSEESREHTHFSIGLLPHFNHQKTCSGNKPGLSNKGNGFQLEPRFFFLFFCNSQKVWGLVGFLMKAVDYCPENRLFLFTFLTPASCKKQSPRNPSCDIIMIAHSSSKSLDPLPRKGQTEVIHLYVSLLLLLHPLWGKEACSRPARFTYVW